MCVEGVILTGACGHLGEDCFRQKPNGYERFPTTQALCRALWPLLQEPPLRRRGVRSKLGTVPYSSRLMVPEAKAKGITQAQTLPDSPEDWIQVSLSGRQMCGRGRASARHQALLTLNSDFWAWGWGAPGRSACPGIPEVKAITQPLCS